MSNEIVRLIVTPIAAAFFLSFTITPFIIKFAKKIGIIDDPKVNKHPKVIHTKPTPRGGGAAIYLAILLSSLLLLPMDKYVLSILIGGALLVVIGILDDKYNLNPYLRILGQVFAALIPIGAGIGISFLSAPFGSIIDLSHPQLSFTIFGEAKSIWILSDLFALIWIVALMNFMNMGAKGVPGQLSGVVTIAAASITALSLRFSADITEWPVTILSAITVGAFLGFLPWHTFPQRIMPSFSGSILGGYMLAVLAILSTAKVGTLLVVLSIPLIDTSYTIIRRILSKKSPVWGDRGHLHHRLLDRGFSQLQVAVVYWTTTLILAILALQLNAASKFYTIIGVLLFVGGSLLLLSNKK